MRRTWPLVVLGCLSPAALLAVPPPAPNPPPAAAGPPPAAAQAAVDDETLLKSAKVGVDGPGLLDYFRRHTTPPEKQEHIQALIKQLGDDAFKVRRAATAELAALGAVAAPYLRRVLDDPDVEVQERAAALVKAADAADPRAGISAAAARLLRQRAPADAAPVLLAYLPDADNDAVEDEVITSLAVLGVHDGKVDAPVVAALKDKAAARRAGAAVVVGRSGTPEQRAEMQAFLNDPDPRVRFRTAEGLLAGRDRAGVAVLVALVKDGPVELAHRSNELLSCAIRGPHVPFEADPFVRQNCAKAWADWAQKNAKTVDLSHADSDLPAFNSAMKAREAARQCFSALVSGDLAAFKKSADAPFLASNEPQFKTRDDLDRYFNENPMGLRNGQFYPVVMGSLSLKEYSRNGSNEDKNFANQHANDAMVILIQQGQYGVQNPTYDPSQGNLFLVRVTGDQAHVIGIIPGRSGIMSVW